MDRNICVNQVYRDIRTDKQFRLLWMAPGQSPSYIYWLDGKTKVPKQVQLDELASGVRQGWLTLEEDPYALKSEASEKDKERRDALWNKMKSALLDEPGIYDRKTRTEHLHRIEQESGETMTNLYRHLGRYWQRGTHSCRDTAQAAAAGSAVLAARMCGKKTAVSLGKH